MLHDAAAGQEVDMSLDDALWCQPVLWYWVAPAFFEIRCDGSSCRPFSSKVTPVDAN